MSPAVRFYPALAAHLHKSLDELFRDVGDWEWPIWETMYRVEGFESRRADNRAGMIAATVANWSGFAASSQNPSDFVHDPWDWLSVDKDELDEARREYNALTAGGTSGNSR